VNDGSCNEAGCFRIKKRTDAMKLTNVRKAKFKQCRYLIQESEMFVKYEAKITSKISSVERRVTYFSSKLLFKPDEKKFILGGIESQWLAIIQEICRKTF